MVEYPKVLSIRAPVRTRAALPIPCFFEVRGASGELRGWSGELRATLVGPAGPGDMSPSGELRDSSCERVRPAEFESPRACALSIAIQNAVTNRVPWRPLRVGRGTGTARVSETRHAINCISLEAVGADPICPST